MDKEKLDCGCRFAIYEIDMVENQETRDNLRETGTGIIIWNGTLETPKGLFKFEMEKSWTEDNGGEGTKILSEKPKDMTDEEWDDFKDEMEEFILEDYQNNKRDWEYMGDY